MGGGIREEGGGREEVRVRGGGWKWWCKLLLERVKEGGKKAGKCVYVCVGCVLT